MEDRAANLAVTGQPRTLQIRLVDPGTGNVRSGLGACTGDSGAPVFEDQNGKSVIVGVVSWSTGPHNSDGCGGLTGVTAADALPRLDFENRAVLSVDSVPVPSPRIGKLRTFGR